MTTSDPDPRWHHRLFVAFQFILPQHLLSGIMYRITRVELRPIKALFIRLFIHAFRVDMTEAAQPDPGHYPSFNAFFTRALKPDARPFPSSSHALLCPADGALSQCGMIEDSRIFQAKGRDYGLSDLLGGEPSWTERFAGGSFATIYLSPRDYHRVHMPMGGDLKGMLHIPGRLFSVNPITTRLVPRLFARNERVACLFDGEQGAMGLVLVGAIFVGSMETVWAGQVTPPPGKPMSRWCYDQCEPTRHLERGDEMGRFNMGSTVILLFPPGRIRWDSELKPGDTVRMGQQIGTLLEPADQ